VIEGDEYDAVYWAKHPKFLDYVGITSDEIAILTSIEHDHVDIYPDATSYEAAFRELLGRMPAGGLVVADAHDARVRAVVSEASRARVAWVALEGDATGDQTPTWLGAPVGSSVHGASAFDLFAGGVSCGRFFLQMPGRHNVRNAIAAIAACAEGFGVAPADARAHLAAFEGVRRRQDLIGQPHGVFVYDDFAHHPTAVDETLRALRARHPTGALWAVFEPRSATACRSLHQEAYATSFAAADHVLLAPVGRSNVPEGDRLDTARLTRDLGAHARDMPNVPAIVAEIASRARPHDCVAILSNGAFGGIHRMLVEALEALDD
jgi:UDP-N-acetylmuramate: L-alanyl-gamma-D-glutamyl-meso-diaminopimelate ligase